jgi:threonine/homoserine/homoserine lactone efflux protein
MTTMLSFDTFALFLSASLLLCIAPGPDNIFVLTQSMLRGGVAGIFVTLGLCTGLIGHTTAVALGIAIIFQKSLLAFTILKLCGAAYLLYMAWGAFRAGAEKIEAVRSAEVSRLTLYRRGIIMNITNPKVSIFFLAFLPQFVDPARGHLPWQFMQLGVVFMISTLIIFGALSLSAGRIGDWFHKTPSAQTVMNRVAGTIFAGLALKLAFLHR